MSKFNDHVPLVINKGGKILRKNQFQPEFSKYSITVFQNGCGKDYFEFCDPV